MGVVGGGPQRGRPPVGGGRRPACQGRGPPSWGGPNTATSPACEPWHWGHSTTRAPGAQARGLEADKKSWAASDPSGPPGKPFPLVRRGRPFRPASRPRTTDTPTTPRGRINSVQDDVFVEKRSGPKCEKSSFLQRASLRAGSVHTPFRLARFPPEGASHPGRRGSIGRTRPWQIRPFSAQRGTSFQEGEEPTDTPTTPSPRINSGQVTFFDENRQGPKWRKARLALPGFSGEGVSRVASRPTWRAIAFNGNFGEPSSDQPDSDPSVSPGDFHPTPFRATSHTPYYDRGSEKFSSFVDTKQIREPHTPPPRACPQAPSGSPGRCPGTWGKGLHVSPEPSPGPHQVPGGGVPNRACRLPWPPPLRSQQGSRASCQTTSSSRHLVCG